MTFFSGTDWSQLEDRACLSNYFLMLITNFKNEHVAKVAFKAKRNGNTGVSLEFANNQDGFKPLVLKGESEKEILVVMDCKIVLEKPEIQVDKSFEDRYESVKLALEEEKKAKIQTYPKSYGNVYSSKPSGFNKWEQGELWDEGILGTKPIYQKKKGFMEMTDEEFRKAMEEEVMGIKEAFIVANFVLDKSCLIRNVNSPFDLLKALDSKFKSKEQLEGFIAEFCPEFVNTFHIYFQNGSDWDLLEVLHSFNEWLLQFKHLRLFKELSEAFEEMIDYQYTVVS